MEYCKNINKDFDMDKIYDDVETTGLSALERFLEFSRLFPSFDVNADIENAYVKENEVEKDFMKFGLKFIKNYQKQ